MKCSLLLLAHYICFGVLFIIQFCHLRWSHHYIGQSFATCFLRNFNLEGCPVTHRCNRSNGFWELLNACPPSRGAMHGSRVRALRSPKLGNLFNVVFSRLIIFPFMSWGHRLWCRGKSMGSGSRWPGPEPQHCHFLACDLGLGHFTAWASPSSFTKWG